MEMEVNNDVPDFEEGLLDWTGTYTCRVENWTQITEEKIYSPEFEIGGYSWRLLIYPRGNEAHGSIDHVSVYLDFPEASFTPPQMCPKVNFKLIGMKMSDPDDSVKHETTHAFTAQASDWGFTQFIPIEEVQNPEHGYLDDDTLIFCVTVTILRDEEDSDSASTRDLTLMGLKKQGDGSYLNCLLQCLFHIGSIRKAIYQIPASGRGASESSVLRAVQTVFFQLQYQDSVVNTSNLRKVMGWESNDAVSQHDLQKIHNTLFGALDRHSTAHGAQSVTSTMFGGRVFECLECLSVQYASTWKQAFMEIQLDVLGTKDIYESLKKFCKFRSLEKTDKDDDTSFRGLIDTRQGALFESFPSVLQFHLKRVFYNPDQNVMLKINSHYEFCDELDLDYKRKAFLPKTADKTIENKYRLYSVIAHRGGPNGGHYFAFIRPYNKWYKFDDEDVEDASSKDAIDEQFGTQGGPLIETFSQDDEEAMHSMACTLVYIRKSEWNRVICEANKEDIPKVIRKRLEVRIMDEETRQEREAHLYVVIKLACEQHFSEQLGKNHYFDLANFDDVKNYRIHKKTPFEEFKEMVRKDFGIPEFLQRFWLWNQRTNHTLRVSKPLIEDEIDLKTVLDLRHFRDKTSPLEQDKTALMTIKLFLESPEEVSHNGVMTGHNFLPIQGNRLLIFLKYYHPELRRLSYLGHLFVEKTSSFVVIFEKAKKMAQLAPEEEIIGFEEVKHLPTFICTELSPDMTPQEIQLIQGDIIIIQKVAEESQCEYPTARSFLEFVQKNSKTVNVKPLKDPTAEGFELELLKTMSYDQVTNELAKHLEVDDSQKLRLTQHDINTNSPYKSPIKYNGIESLKQMIMHDGQYTYILYYEVLDMPLPYLETLKCFTIGFHNAKGEQQSEHQLRLSKDKRVSDLVKVLKAELDEEYIDCDIRVMEILSSKVLKVLDPEGILEEMYSTYSIFRAEVIPEDQKSLKSDEYLVLFCHCRPVDKSMKAFGDPLWVKVKLSETVRQVRVRIQKTLEISNREFSHWRFAYHARPMHPVEYLRDKDEILAKFSGIALRGGTHGKFVGDNTSFIALQHEDTRLKHRTPRSMSLPHIKDDV